MPLQYRQAELARSSANAGQCVAGVPVARAPSHARVMSAKAVNTFGRRTSWEYARQENVAPGGLDAERMAEVSSSGRAIAQVSFSSGATRSRAVRAAWSGSST